MIKKKDIGSVFALYPTPTAVVGTVDFSGKVNWMLVGHVGIVSHHKLLISMHSAHYTNAVVKESKKLSVNLVNEAILQRADYVGTVSGKKTDKSAVFDYHLGDGDTPVIDDADLVMECDVVDIYEIDSFENFICSISHTHVNETMLDASGKIDYEQLKPILFEMPTYSYIKTGAVAGKCLELGKAYRQNLKLP
ncbi:MAG: flavin reductase family protein [Desulfovibrio sp.]|nr:flavin reductase family protein [Desulfovibrio sp.]